MKWITEILEDNARKEQNEIIKKLKLQNMENTTPRKFRQDQWTPAEKAINDALLAVEAIGADTVLTEATILLQQAQEKVAKYVDDNI